MANIQVRGHHKVVNGRKIWVEDYYRDGVKLSDSEAAKLRLQRANSGQSLGVMAVDETEGPVDTNGGWNLESKQNKVADLMVGLNTTALPPGMRAELEHHIENFLQNEDQTTNEVLASTLDGFVEGAQMRLAQNYEQANAMLEQIRTPITEEGRQAKRMLQEVATGARYFDEVTTGFVDEAFWLERRTKKTMEVAQEILPAVSQASEAARQTSRQIRDLPQIPIQEAYPRLKRTMEELEHSARKIVAHTQDDFSLAQQTEGNVREIRNMMSRLENDFASLRRNYSNGINVDYSQTESMMATVRRLAESLEMLEFKTRRLSNGESGR